jgi:hypothetical protein
MNGDVIYDNNKQCGRLPTHEEILSKIGNNTLLEDKKEEESAKCCDSQCG